jgi:hypothetical protein
MAVVEKIFRKVFNYLPDHFNEIEVNFHGYKDEICIDYLNDTQCLIVSEDGEIFNENDEFVGYISDLYYFTNFVEYNQCPDCYDNGYTRSEVYGFDTIESEEIEKCSCINRPFNF